MPPPSVPFAIRPLASGGTTVGQLRQAVRRAPADANLVLLQSMDRAPRFPPICPNCHQLTAATLHIERAFLFHVQSGDDTPNDTLQSIDAFDVPFCDACLRQHRAEQRPPSPWTPLRRVFSEANGFAGIVVIAIAGLFLRAAIEHLSLVPLLLACLPLTIGFWLLRATWKRSRHMSLPQPTSVDLAVDFTPSLARPFEPAWRAFLFRSPHYADLFRRANERDIWNPDGAEAQSAAVLRRQKSVMPALVIGAVLAAFLLWSLWEDYLAPLVMPYFQR